MIADALRAWLLSKTAVTDLVGQSISPLAASVATAMPYVTYAIDVLEHDHDLSGPSGLAIATISLEAWDASYATTKSIAEALRGALDGYSGTWSGITILAVIVDQQTDADPVPPQNAADAATYHASTQCRVFFHESIPAP